uniref:Opioid growth factor receptor (OGFr) conserved domain-containing protein n=1 Tax=Oreochromis niloticus TaxID=8128 RepID=A0A669EYC4_ORENI
MSYTLIEVQCFLQDFLNHSIAKENLLKSYKLMLDFYGIVLCDEKTGEVRRAEHWEERFHNLNSHTHNNLCITRILKCLGNLGYPHYQAPLVYFFLEETLVNGQLPNIRDSVLSYFLFAVLNKTQCRNLIKYAYLNYEPKDEFVWCPKKIKKLWSMQSKAAKEDAADSLGSQEDTLISDIEAQEEENLSADELLFISFAYLNYKPNDGFVWFQRKIQNVVVRDAQAQKETLNLNSDFYAALLPGTTSEGYASPSGTED